MVTVTVLVLVHKSGRSIVHRLELLSMSIWMVSAVAILDNCVSILWHFLWPWPNSDGMTFNRAAVTSNCIGRHWTSSLSQQPFTLCSLTTFLIRTLNFRRPLISQLCRTGGNCTPSFFKNKRISSPCNNISTGSQLDLSEENVLGVLSACRDELGTLFGYSAENRGVGITGGVDYVGLDGPSVIISLKGRYWHQRTTVLERVSNYLMQRIPEIIDVTVEDPWQLTDEANEG